ncbi:MAG: hypothetical protein U1D30_03855 [Planctomycetota bacterium]
MSAGRPAGGFLRQTARGEAGESPACSLATRPAERVDCDQVLSSGILERRLGIVWRGSR